MTDINEDHSSVDDADLWKMTPLGAGQEVGRSCHLLEYKNKKILLDCGIHPGMSGLAGTPYLDEERAKDVDLLLITHFHLDHAGALPWFLQRFNFKGRVFMTHATKAIYRWLLSDYIKVSNISSSNGQLYSEADLEESMDRIETIDFHEQKSIKGINFWCYHAGHVLGAAMFMIEIAGVRVLYTGDYSREEDRHLMAAEIPAITPDVLITESTYGTHIHEAREEREVRFTNKVREIVERGGRCLIPVFALGRAQELLLILDDYWANHPELHDIPIYYASSLAKKCMSVYQTYSNAMNSSIRKQWHTRNPFQFRHISNLKGMDKFDDVGPSVVMASPGMMQSGLSRQLFENWCEDALNGTIIAGYCVEGTLAKQILKEPSEVSAMDGRRLKLKMSVDYISFSAHADYKQGSEFVRAMKPPHVILVHGEATEMGRLKKALEREYEDDADTNIVIHTPENKSSVQLEFRGEKRAKVMKNLAKEKRRQDEILSGILVKRNFNYHIFEPEDLKSGTNLPLTSVLQKASVTFSAPISVLKFHLEQVDQSVQNITWLDGAEGLLVFGCVKVAKRNRIVTVEWESSIEADLYAETVMSFVLRVESDPQAQKINSVQMKRSEEKKDEIYKDRLKKMLVGMYGDGEVENGGLSDEKEEILMKIAGCDVTIDWRNRVVECDNRDIKDQIKCSIDLLYAAVMPIESC